MRIDFVTVLIVILLILMILFLVGHGVHVS